MSDIINSIDNALKTLYLGIIAEQINCNSSPLVARIKKASDKVYGKDIFYYDKDYITKKSELENNYVTLSVPENVLKTENISQIVNLLNSAIESMLQTQKAMYSKRILDKIIEHGHSDSIECDMGNISNTIIDYDIDMLICSLKTRREYLEYMQSKNKNIDYISLDNGFKAISISGIPLIVDKNYNSNTMLAINTNDFEIQQLCDWRWLENDDGRIIRQVGLKPYRYETTLVKYDNLICKNKINTTEIKIVQK